MAMKAEGVSVDMEMVVPMITKGCMKKEEATCKAVTDGITEATKSDETKKEKRDETTSLVPTMSVAACKLK